MKFINIYILIFLVLIFILLVVILKQRIKIIIYAEIHDKNMTIKVNVRYLFDLINVTKELYSNTSKKKKKEEKSIANSRVLLEDILDAYDLLKDINIEGMYSEIIYGNTNVKLTTGVYVLVNAIYGFFANVLNPKNMNLNIY
ncbi:MAG: hypothetical protein LBR30_03175, partial [Clostridioides sp.]|nr:hypothetical protein [Clostridioides sp.]